MNPPGWPGRSIPGCGCSRNIEFQGSFDAYSQIFNICNTICLVNIQIALGFQLGNTLWWVQEQKLIFKQIWVPWKLFSRISSLFTKSKYLSISENKSCLEIKFGWAPDYLKQLSGCGSERRSQGLFEYQLKKWCNKFWICEN